jgi:hypothetical protein
MEYIPFKMQLKIKLSMGSYKGFIEHITHRRPIILNN